MSTKTKTKAKRPRITHPQVQAAMDKNLWKEMRGHRWSEWQDEVVDNCTTLGYWEWVQERIIAKEENKKARAEYLRKGPP